MKTINPTYLSLLSALFIAAGTVSPGYGAPTGAECQARATAAAEKVKKSGGTEAQQQAAYSQAKMKCKEKM